MILLAISIGLVCAFLGAWAGAEGTSKGFRRYGVPFVLTIIAGFITSSSWALSCLSLIGVLSLGYGESSHIRTWWRSLLNEDEGQDKKSDILTRSTIGLLEGLCFISIPILTGAWLPYAIFVATIVAIQTLFGAIIENEGMVKVFGKDLLLEEAYRYGGLGLLAFLLVYLTRKGRDD